MNATKVVGKVSAMPSRVESEFESFSYPSFTILDIKKKRGRPRKHAKKNGKSSNEVTGNPPSKEAVDFALQLKAQLCEKVESFGDKLPPNTLDVLIEELGGPESVAEVSVLRVFKF
jgi:hypothetical protein